MTNFSNLEEGKVISGSFWDEPVRISSIVSLAPGRIRIEGEGTKTSQHYKPILTSEDLSKIQVKAPSQNLKGGPEKLYLRLLAEQIRMSYGFDPFFGLTVSKVDPVPHQLEAVYDYILKKPRINFLLADDAGAGKTIMGGLTIEELKYRGLADDVLIVTPKYLSYQWKRELKEKFNEEFITVDRPVLRSYPTENAWREINRGIVSVDLAKREDVRQSLSDVRWDLVIVDEAHKLAAYKRAKNKIERTERFKLGRILEENTNNLLLLSATPHKGDVYHFFLLLSLLDRDIFDPKIVQRNILSPPEMNEKISQAIRNENNPIFLRRLKEDMKKLDGSPLFPPRKFITLKYEIEGKEKKLYDAVTNYVERYYRKATRQNRTNVAFALIILQRRFASSIHAGRKSLERRLEGIKETLERGVFEEEEALLPEGVDSIEKFEEELEDLPEKERWKIEEKMARAAERGQLTSAENREELKLEKEKLEQLVELARKVENTTEERKLKELWKVLEREDLIQTGNKLLVFTEAKDTLFYLRDKFKQKGYNTTTIHGDKSTDERREAEKDFKEGDAQIMIATEAAREGINLQKSCWLMVNYDIPWNPNRLEQRLGRIHRYGQDKTVHAYNLVAKNTREGRVLSVVLDKLEKIRNALGTDKVFDVIGNLFEGKSLETLISRAIAENRPADVYDRLGDVDEDAAEKIKEYTKESLAKKHINLSHIADLLRKNKEEKLPPEYIEEFFVRAFTRFDGRIEKRSDDLWYVKYVPAKIRDVSKENSFQKRYGNVKERYGLIAFDRETAQEEDVDFITPGHPLLEAVIELIHKKFYSDLKQGSIFYDPDGKYDGIIWFFKSSFKDGMNEVVDESVIPVYQPLDGDPRPVNLNLVWDLVPGDEEKDVEKYEEILEKKEDALNLVFDRLDEEREKITERREEEANIKKSYAEKTLKSLITEADGKIMEYQKKKEKEGEDMELKIREEQKRKEQLKSRLDGVIKEAELKSSITYENPNLLTSIVVKPHPAPTTEGMRRDEEVEEVAMKKSMEYERENGRNPKDVSEQNLGYDIKSTENGEVRYIEVKGRAQTGELSLSTNEWVKANRLGEEFWLYIVTDAKQDPRLHKIQDPASQLKPNQKVRYIVPEKNWQEHAKEVG